MSRRPSKAAQRFPIQVRLERERARRHRRDSATCSLPRPTGKVIPLGQVAEIKRVEGPSEIASENGRLRVFVQANVQDRDLGGFVEEVKARIDARLSRICRRA